ncbi:DUF1573 domain-containing protein [Algoriphagus confluentis]|uniref:DUF1573 domain-containing protein n=1 Tax=Algoriphagus confluentis TaxID=1697556 RepID=A0ABQ6PTN5_9BACT|nr:hypothetical protein Aconfl_39780 [Algoriphagus confluentis]
MKQIFYFLLTMCVFMSIVWIARDFGKLIFQPRIEFEVKRADLDTLKIQDEAYFYFVYKNKGFGGLQIYEVTTSCGCTVPDWNSDFLGIFEKDSFRVDYNIENKGYFIKEIIVYSNSSTSPDKLEFVGYVPFE